MTRRWKFLNYVLNYDVGDMKQINYNTISKHNIKQDAAAAFRHP